MNFQEFEAQTKDATHLALEQLQSAMLLVEEFDQPLLEQNALKLLLESQVLGAGSSIKDLTALIERFVEERRDSARS